MHIHGLIEDSAALANLCNRFANKPFVAVDTEFMRENSYWPELCLIQIADDEEAAAVDPMADGLDLTPLLHLLTENQDVLKVFHAGGQDIEIVYNLTGKTPHPLFDTQVAAMALGQGEQIGYSNLVDSYLGISIDKGARFTDWSRRPLDKRQIDYAIADVTHLSKIFPKMLDKLMKTGRGAWLDEEMERLSNPENYRNDPDAAWQRVRIPSRKADVLGRLKALARWRELEAQNKDLPRGRIVKDETLADLAGNPPRKQADLGRVRGLSSAWSSNDIGGRLVAALADAKPLSSEEMPSRDSRKPALGKDGALVADLLKLLLKIRAKEISVAARLLARSDDLEALAAGQREDLAILRGWRYEQFGRDALALVEGQLGFTVRNGKLKMTRTEETEETA
ncbi:ribonuclease D [Stakelama tenebrarum]|uniref:Ribonuclease D n=1 Tax=Stakelama tenebrarum TaxID=2711215 RepID=A0A6G6Y6V7_9SPHN|nr:ribonuclease D [Sphingosinithalassobacter tenebrarum]QIG80313.1 ribonuclease D [Sphingosinithalassobacter tenebrarum]